MTQTSLCTSIRTIWTGYRVRWMNSRARSSLYRLLKHNTSRAAMLYTFVVTTPDALGLRIDVMSVMRGVDPFAQLWDRRTTLHVAPAEEYDLLSLPDLVNAKKMQRDKDWPMIRRLVEASYFRGRSRPTAEEPGF